MFDEDSRELLEGMEGASVQEKLVDTDFFNRFEVSALFKDFGLYVAGYLGTAPGQHAVSAVACADLQLRSSCSSATCV